MSMIEIALREINGKEIPAVTSLQVAEHFGKEHRNVLADIRNTMDKCSESFSALNFQLSQYTSVMPTGGNKELPMYLLSKDGFMMVAMGYTTPEAMRIKEAYIARFNDMERELTGRNPSLPQTYADALRALAAEVEIREAVEQQKALAESQRDEAIRTKAWINDKKTATAMATASVAVRKVNALEDELGRGKRYKAVKAISWLLTEFVESRGMYSVVGKALKRMSSDLGYSVEKIATAEYPDGINAYHVDVIAAFRAELAQNSGMLDRYRKRRAA